MNKIQSYLLIKKSEIILIYKAIVSIRHVRKKLIKCKAINLKQARKLASEAFDQTYFLHKAMPDYKDFEINKIGSMVLITDMFYQIRKKFEAKNEVSGICSKEIQNIKLDISDTSNAKLLYKIGFLDRAIITEIIDEYENNFSKIQIIK